MAASVVTWFIKSNCPTVDISTAHRIVGLVTNSPSYCLRALVTNGFPANEGNITCHLVLSRFPRLHGERLGVWPWHTFDDYQKLVTDTARNHTRFSHVDIFSNRPFALAKKPLERCWFQVSEEILILPGEVNLGMGGWRWSMQGQTYLEKFILVCFLTFQVRGLWSVSYV